MPEAFDPAGLPGNNLWPELVENAATQLVKIGDDVGNQARITLSSWQGIAAVYEAPEAATLFGVMDPVKTDGEAIDADMGQLARPLRTYARAIEALKVELAALAADGRAFRASIAGGVEQTFQTVEATTRTVEWHEDPASIRANDELHRRANELQEKLWRIEEECASGIRAIVGLPPIGIASAENGWRGWGLADVPEGLPMPWGAPVERTESCGDKLLTDVVWDSWIVNGVVGGIQVTGSLLFGIDWQTGRVGQPDVYAAAWSGLGLLTLGALTHGAPGNLANHSGPIGDLVRRSQAAVDAVVQNNVETAQHDPYTFWGDMVFNTVTFLVPTAAAATVARGGTSAAARGLRGTDDVLRAMDVPGLVVDRGIALTRWTAPQVRDFVEHHDFADMARTIEHLRADDLTVATPRGEGGAYVPVRSVGSLTWELGGVTTKQVVLAQPDGTITAVVVRESVDASGQPVVHVQPAALDRGLRLLPDGSIELVPKRPGPWDVDPAPPHGSVLLEDSLPADVAPDDHRVPVTAAQQRSLTLVEALLRGAAKPGVTALSVESIKTGVTELNEARAAGRELQLEDLPPEVAEVLRSLPDEELALLVQQDILADETLHEPVPAGG